MSSTRILLGLLAISTAGPAFAEFPDCPTQHWTPASLQYKEQLPNTHRPGEPACKITQLSIGYQDWMGSVRLPETFGLLRIANTSTSSKDVLDIRGPIMGLPGEPFRLPSGRSIEFAVGGATNALLEDNHLYQLTVPDQPRWQIPANKYLISMVNLHDGMHAPELLLPGTATAYETVAIHNQATVPTNVLGAHTAFPGQRLTVLPGQSARAEFDAIAQQWHWTHVPYDLKTGAQWRQRTSARSLVQLHDGNWNAQVVLPDAPFDRDRVAIRSDATQEAAIVLDGNEDNQRLPLRKGDHYEFVHVAEWKRWYPLRHPIQKEQLNQLPGGHLPDHGYLLTQVTAGPDITKDAQLLLPAPRTGARVVLYNHSSAFITIAGGSLRETARPREQIAFHVNEAGHWTRETTTIDLMFVVDEQVEDIGGASIALRMMRDNLSMANEALENSGAAFRYRETNALTSGFRFPGVESPRIARDLGRNAYIKTQMKMHQADGIYYGGTRNATHRLPCGASFTSPLEHIYSVASSLLCPQEVLREQLVHALGMPQGQKAKPVQVIGHGNQVPFYPTEHKLLPDGRRAFNPGQEDYLQRMNERATIVAGFSNQS